VRYLLRPTALKRKGFFIIADILLSLVTLFLAYNLRFNFQIPTEFYSAFWLVYGLLIGLKLLFFSLFKNYRIVWRFFGFFDTKNIVKAHLGAYLSFVVIFLLFPEVFSPFPRSVIIIDLFLSLIFIGGVRASKRLLSEGVRQEEIKPMVIIGVNSKTETIIQSALKGEIDYSPVAITSLDNNETTMDTYINSVRVYPLEQLEALITQKGIVSAIVAQKITQAELKVLVHRLNQAGVHEIKRVRLLGSQHEHLEDLSIEDLLARHPKDLDLELIAQSIVGKRVLITGAGGSIGSEIARQCQQFGAVSLTLVDHSEYNLYQIGEQLSGATLRLLSVTDREGLQRLFGEVNPELVIHAAAYKHVPICEANQAIAVRNNVLGSKNIVDVSIQRGVSKLVLISTDKAVRPTNVMGATKRVTELYANNVDAKATEIVAVRFGNVLGSSGSVIPKFKQQIEAGGPVTVTHPEITRYFMLISEACQLVLQTAAIAKGGELFVLDMGEPIKIADLAKQMIELYGKAEEVEISFTGLRPGEKLYEELLIDESEKQTLYRSIFIAQRTHYPIAQLTQDIQTLLDAEDKVQALQHIVPEFVRRDAL